MCIDVVSDPVDLSYHLHHRNDSEMTVSAIVSAYYAKDFIRARLDNLFSLDPRPEVIVVAQLGSVEAEIAKTYDVTWILTPDIPTIYAAWNMAIKAANGEYITNANCDDTVYPDSYTHMASLLESNPDIAVVYGNNLILDGPTKMLHKRNHGDYEFLKTCCFVGPMPMWRKSLHDKYGYFNELFNVCGDYEFWLRVASHGEFIHHTTSIIGEYRKRPESAEHRNLHLAMSEKLFIQKFYKGIAIREKIW